MMIKIGLFCVAALASVVFTGCIKSSDNGEYDRIRPVEAGLYIYNAASSQHSMALQPADIALRLAVLRAEAVKQGKENELDLIFVSGIGNVKTQLFGVNTKITQSNGVYEISYAGGGGMPRYDAYMRVGIVRVITGGKALEQTDATTAWKVIVGTEKLVVSGSRSVTLVSSGDTYVCRKGNVYEIGFMGAIAYIDKDIPSKWTGSFVWIPEQAEDISLSNLSDKSFEISGSGSGDSFWTMDRKTPLAMAYEVSGGRYDPSEFSSFQIVGGIEMARLTNPAQYDPVTYPASDVKLTWTFKDKYLFYVVDYNNNSISFDY